jgi:F0F1-type ATP synthase membrane subunit b/b'
MDILKSLGVNSTLWIHLVCFLVSYVSFSQLVLKPYMAALREREKRTLGNEEAAVRLIEEAHELHEHYETKARALSSQIKGFYDQSRSEALKEYDRLVTTARDEAGKILDESRGKIATQIQGARQMLSAEVPAVGAAIAAKLAGKEISQ